MSHKTGSLLSEIQSFRGRCTGRRSRYTLDGRVLRSFDAFLEAAYEAPLRDVMQEFYWRREMSSTDMQRYFSDLFGFPVKLRTISYALSNSGVRPRDYAERKGLSWKQGKMDGVIPRLRQASKRTFLLGSRAEQTVRFLLRQGLLLIDAEWDAVIGDNLQHILSRYEVDIPVILVDRVNGRACRIAVEVDSRFAHSAPERQAHDAIKTRALMEAGWHVLRIDGDKLKDARTTSEEMTGLMLAVKRIAEETFSSRPVETSRCA